MNAKEFYKKLSAPMVWGNLLAMFVVVILLCFGLKWWLSAYTHHGEGVKVPDLYGLKHQEAVEKFEADELVVVVNDSTYVNGMPAGAIVSQSPEPGMEVKRGLGFVLLAPKLIDGEKDWVYGIQFRGRNLVAGDNVPRESELTLVIGNGSAGEDVSSEDGEVDESGLSDVMGDDIDDFLEVE